MAKRSRYLAPLLSLLAALGTGCGERDFPLRRGQLIDGGGVVQPVDRDAGVADTDQTVYSCFSLSGWCDEEQGLPPLTCVDAGAGACPRASTDGYTVEGCRLGPDLTRWYYFTWLIWDGGPPGGLPLGISPPPNCRSVDGGATR